MSYGLYIGKNLTADGIAYLAGYGDEPSSHWLEIVPRAHHPAGATIHVGVTPQADLPGVMSTIPQVAETARNIRVSYSYYLGVPAPLTNGGLNEHGVAVRDIWSTSRDELIALTPKDQSGPNYSDLARIVLERARSAREGVDLIADLIARHGYADYGGNSHLIADANEAWVVIECSGGKGLWAAERLGADSVRASRPGYIGVIPIDQPNHPDFRYSPNLVSFAVEQGWFDPAAKQPFDLNKVYGDGKGRWAGVAWIEGEMTRRAARREKIGIADIFWAVRTEKLTGDTAGYGQVVPLYGKVAPELRMLWHTQVGAIAAPFAPVFMGVSEVPEEYRQHRYLTTGESARFLDLRHGDAVSIVPQGIESTRSASAVFKRLQNLVAQHDDLFRPEVTAVWEAIERKLTADYPGVVDTVQTLIDAGKPQRAAAFLTYYCRTELLAALELGETLTRSIEARTRALFGISADPVPKSAAQIW
ncbi:C69 family dipeptidase [Dongia rigui]|uniref:Dipeptidase n=1 Tax=Dongia rigui TaxID=940149 RepID=A0ABU5E151_9PROT|nr:C69 family dipeptidase [Dongia rigui]MDY0872643.1 C69 family dipeptidase [Dongia rigui]